MNSINVAQFKKMLKSGAANLSNHAEEINKLNVFPVPDGDTGTNMSMTFANGYKEVEKCSSDSLNEILKALSKGLLMGARGNSGVIVSQIFRGFYQQAENAYDLSAKEIADAFENGARVAYKAIMKPVEGTILTVIREASWYANHDFESEPNIDIPEYFSRLLKYAQESLETTPNLLPVLQEVGVVDSGGSGLVALFEGFDKYFKGQPVEFVDNKAESKLDSPIIDIENDEFGYCTEFIIRLNKPDSFDDNILKEKMSKLGESLVVVKDDDLCKVHVHTLKPGDALNLAQRYGEFVKLKIENMQEQHTTILNSSKEVIPSKEYGVIVVASGEGLTELFKKCHADIVISGGQTMNPSCENIVSEIDKLKDCKNILIFPNNSNIILAAKQAKELRDKYNVIVVETSSIQAGLSCLSNFDVEASLEDNINEFSRIISSIQVGSLTYAIKDTCIEGIEVKENDYIGMANKKIVSSNQNRIEVVKTVLDSLIHNEEAEILVIIKGENADDEEVLAIEKYVTDNSDLEVEILEGNQPVYTYLFSVE